MSHKVASMLWLLLLTCLTSGVATIANNECAANSECDSDLSLLQVDSSINHRSGKPRPLELVSGAEEKAVKAKQLPNAMKQERPGLRTDEIDKITFGVLLKKWHGINFAKGHSALDGVITLQWKDKRATVVIPAGQKHIRLSLAEAKANIWMPDISITNLAKKGSDVISSSVLIELNGDITKVERTYMHLKESFEIHNFPFDTQNATCELASATYMDDELQLVPTTDDTLWGVPAGSHLFANSAWSFQKSSITSYIDEDGDLKKSRGIMTYTVKRNPAQFLNAVGLPSVVLLSMTWTAFWLPMNGPYVMPRVAINAFGLLCQLTVSHTAQKTVPANGQQSMMTQYLSLCVELQFTVMILNVLLLALEAGMSKVKVGGNFTADINNTIIVTFPITTVFNVLVLCLGYFTVSNIFVVCTMLFYLIHISVKFYEAKKQQEDAEGEDKKRRKVSRSRRSEISRKAGMRQGQQLIRSNSMSELLHQHV